MRKLEKYRGISPATAVARKTGKQDYKEKKESLDQSDDILYLPAILDAQEHCRRVLTAT